MAQDMDLPNQGSREPPGGGIGVNPRLDPRTRPREEIAVAEPVNSLGGRLRALRLRSGVTLREFSRQLGVSPSFVSQIETGKSQPSVATLYSIAQLLDVSIDELFASVEPGDMTTQPGDGRIPGQPAAADGASADETAPIDRAELGSPADAFPRDGSLGRMSVTRPGERSRIEMGTGVIWERLADNTGTDLDFIQIIYPPHSSSTSDDRMLQHSGWEFGYLLTGELEITVGFDVFTLRAGDALGFNSSQPHLFRNLGTEPATGIWFVRHPQGS